MYQGKYAPKHRGKRRRILSAALIVLILAMFTIGGTVAFLITKSDPIQNTFTPVKTDIKIHEDFDNEIKENVKVKNKCDYPVYVRATYVAYWVNDADNSVLAEPVTLTKSEIGDTWGSAHGDGYWYYNKILGAGETSAPFIVEMAADKIEGRHLVIDVIMETVQADGIGSDGKTPVQDVWGIDASTFISKEGTT